MSSHGINMDTPKCVALLLCNEVIEDKRTNNKTVVSIFNSIAAPAVPTLHDRMFIMASLTGQKGKWRLTLRIAAPSGTEVVKVEGDLEISVADEVSDIVLELRQVPLNEEGTYYIDLLLGESLISGRRFIVKQFALGTPSG